MATSFDYENRDVTVTLTRKVRNVGDEIAPVFWRITYRRKHKFYKTGLAFTVSEWEDFLKRGLQRHSDMKKTLKNWLKRTLVPIIDTLVEDDGFSFDALNSRLGKSDITNLNEAFTAKIKSLYEDDRVNYADSLKSTLNSLQRFKKNPIQFAEVTVDFLRKYEKYLLDEEKSVTTIGFYMRNIRTVINGDGEPYLKGSRYPFGAGGYKYTIPKGERREMALSLAEIHMIQAYQCTESIQLFRDLWLFSFYGNGINMTDICRLKYSDIQDGELTFIRKKTKNKRRTVVRIFIPVTRPIDEIIRKHGNKDRGGYIFPFLNGKENEKQRVRKIADVTKEVNDTMRKIAINLKLPDGITGYSTRHSYVTILERLNVPRIFIQNSLGHTSESVTDSYSKMAERELRFKYNSLLLPKTNEEILKNLVDAAKKELVYN